MDVLFIESIYLIAASGKLFHGPQEVRKAWMFSFLLGFKVCCGEGWCRSYLEIWSYCCTHPILCTLIHWGTKGASSFLTCVEQLNVTHFAMEYFFLGL